MINTKKFTFLEKVGIDPKLLEALTQQNVTLVLGFFDLKFMSPQGVELGNYKLPKSTNDIMKGLVDPMVKEAIKGGLTHVIMKAVNYENKEALTTGKGILTVNDEVLGTVTDLKLNFDIGKPATIKVPHKALSVEQDTANNPPSPSQYIAQSDSSLKALLESPTIPLKQATKMYQPVKGTDPGSRYFAIAYGSGIAVAVRITNMVSIRVEGNLTSEIKNTFHKMGIQDNGTYLSGHFDAKGSNVIPERVVGAVLMGSGLEFTSPMPNLTYIKAEI
jgi:hypothetical protein